MKQTTTVHQISDFDTTEMYEKLEKKMKPLYDQLYTTDNEKKIVQLHKQIKKITEAFDEKLFASRNKYATMKLTNVEDGDLVEFTKESGHRSEGIFIIRKTPKRFQLKKLSREFDDYGYVGDDYSLGPDKLPGFAAQIGAWVRKIKILANNFRNSIENESEVSELKKIISEQKSQISDIQKSVNEKFNEKDK